MEGGGSSSYLKCILKGVRVTVVMDLELNDSNWSRDPQTISATPRPFSSSSVPFFIREGSGNSGNPLARGDGGEPINDPDGDK